MKSFEYNGVDNENTNYDSAAFEPYWFRVALLSHARKTLESIKFIFKPMDQHYMGNFTRFKVLKSLELEPSCLIRDLDFPKEDSLSKALPCSLEKLCLRLPWRISHQRRIPRLIMALVMLKNQNTPQLQEVRVIVSNERDDLDYDDGLRSEDIFQEYVLHHIILTLSQ